MGSILDKVTSSLGVPYLWGGSKLTMGYDNCALTKATYRIPLALREQIKATAQAESLSVDDVARLALERFVADYQAGRVEFAKHPIRPHFTLYPRSPGEGSQLSLTPERPSASTPADP